MWKTINTQCLHVSTPLEVNCKLQKSITPKTSKEIVEMKDILYKELVHGLMYAMAATIPYLYNVINIVSQFMFDPSIEHQVVAMKILSYLQNTKNMWPQQLGDGLEEYSNLDQGKDLDFRGSM